MERKPWQIAENQKTEDQFDVKSPEAGGYPADETRSAAPSDDDKDDDDKITKEDWGDVDPQPDQGTDPMDPSGPGSAV